LIQGHNAADTLKGLAGNDVLVGLGGRDVLYGGTAPTPELLTPSFDVHIDASLDVFRYISATDSGTTASSRDLIVDFESGRDHIDLSAIDARVGLGGNKGASYSFSGNNAFSFIDTDDFSGVAGQLRYEHTGIGRTSATIVEGDTNGNGLADFQIELSGRKVLDAGDFIL
jgi:Ca2+-binding RTX toxin-like protein